MEEQVQAQTPEQTAVQQDAPASGDSVELNLNDLGALKTIIDIASQRGAFKANELEAVGKTYNRLTNFLNQVAKGQ